jgi:bleomycin hydrolase
MVFLGVDLVNGKPVKWKVENSWGDKVGKQGVFIMNHNWFEEHVYSLIINKKYLTKTMLQQFKKKPIVLPPWHPMI